MNQLNHLQPINWNEDASWVADILNFRLQIQEHTRFPWQEENMPSSAFPVCCPQTNVIMNDILLTVENNNTIHTMLSRCPHTN